MKTKPDQIATILDWASAFDRQDATLGVRQFLDMGVRPALIPILPSYLTNREMKMRLPGGPQGTLLGLIEYFVQSNDNADCVDPTMIFKYVDDLTVLELVMLTNYLTEYNSKHHVANDIGSVELYVSAEN